MKERLRSSPRHGYSESFETRSLPTLTHCFPRNFTFYVAHPIRSILVGPALLVRFAQGARERLGTR